MLINKKLHIVVELNLKILNKKEQLFNALFQSREYFLPQASITLFILITVTRYLKKCCNSGIIILIQHIELVQLII